MNIFNTKKYRLEWERKLEERYKQGKKDAVEEALISIDKSAEDKEKWTQLSEKELLIEIMNSLNLHNMRLANMNDKINYLSDYRTLFKEIDCKIKELKECENSLHKNIEKSKEQVSKIEENANQIIIKVEKIDKTLEKIIEIKQKIEKIIDDFNKAIPELKNTCVQINDIASNMNNVIQEYSDSPMTILNNLKANNKDILDSIESMQNDIDNLNEIIEKEYDEYNYDSIHSILEDIKSTVDSSLDTLGYNSLYSKIDSIKDELNNNSNTDYYDE